MKMVKDFKVFEGTFAKETRDVMEDTDPRLFKFFWSLCLSCWEKRQQKGVRRCHLHTKIKTRKNMDKNYYSMYQKFTFLFISII